MTDRPAIKTDIRNLTLTDVLREAFVRARDMDVPLADRLNAFADAVRYASPQFAATVDRLIRRLEQSGSGAMAPRVGEVLPPFLLPDDTGHLVALDDVLERGPAAISFHRGHWCPYCRINSSALAAAQCEVEPFGAQIVAVTPDTQRFSMALRSRSPSGRILVLSDIDNGYAMSLNLAIYVGRELQAFMIGAGWDIAPYQGNASWMLPIPATFVVNRAGVVTARFVDPDYRRRMAIEDIVEALNAAR